MKIVRRTLLLLYINLILVISLLVFLLRGMLENNMGNWIQWSLTVSLVISGILNVIFAIMNIVKAFTLFKNNDYNSMRKHMKVLKLGSIPYFIINFVLYLLLFLLFFAASRGIILVTPLPLLFLIPICFTYLTVVLTSFYGIGFAALLRRQKSIGTGNLIIHVFLQLCFVLDVIDTIVLIIKHKANGGSVIENIEDRNSGSGI